MEAKYMDRFKYKKISVIFSLTLFLSGCSFSTDEKKQIILQEQESSSDIQEETVKEPQAKKIIASPRDNQESGIENKADPSLKIINKLVSWGFLKKNKRDIDTIIIHSSYNAVGKDTHDLDDIIYKEYQPYGVSPHYIISREGEIYRLVADNNVAYHAGKSQVPDGRGSVNDFSIGIEIVNTKSEKPTEKQYTALKSLIKSLKNEYEIKYVLGHSEIAPGRKDDPWNFDWKNIRAKD